MTEEDTPRPSGIDIGSRAPDFDTVDIDGNRINLDDMLREYNGVLIDFFRGNW